MNRSSISRRTRSFTRKTTPKPSSPTDSTHINVVCSETETDPPSPHANRPSSSPIPSISTPQKGKKRNIGVVINDSADGTPKRKQCSPSGKGKGKMVDSDEEFEADDAFDVIPEEEIGEHLDEMGHPVKEGFYSPEYAEGLLLESGISKKCLDIVRKFLDIPIVPGRTFSSAWTDAPGYEFFRDVIAAQGWEKLVTFTFPTCPIEVYLFFALHNLSDNGSLAACFNNDDIAIDTTDIETVTGTTTGGFCFLSTKREWPPCYSPKMKQTAKSRFVKMNAEVRFLYKFVTKVVLPRNDGISKPNINEIIMVDKLITHEKVDFPRVALRYIHHLSTRAHKKRATSLDVVLPYGALITKILSDQCILSSRFFLVKSFDSMASGILSQMSLEVRGGRLRYKEKGESPSGKSDDLQGDTGLFSERETCLNERMETLVGLFREMVASTSNVEKSQMTLKKSLELETHCLRTSLNKVVAKIDSLDTLVNQLHAKLDTINVIVEEVEVDVNDAQVASNAQVIGDTDVATAAGIVQAGTGCTIAVGTVQGDVTVVDGDAARPRSAEVHGSGSDQP